MKITIDIPDEDLCALWLNQWGEEQLKRGITSPSPEEIITHIISGEARRYLGSWEIAPEDLDAWRSTLPQP